MHWLAIRYLLAISIGALMTWFAQDWRLGSKLTKLELEHQEQRVAALDMALSETRRIKSETQRIIDRQRDEIATLNIGLDRTLSELRDRPPRLPSPTTSCEGTTGAELSRTDAEFLAREAARADRIRSALKACYEVYDATTSVSKP